MTSVQGAREQQNKTQQSNSAYEIEEDDCDGDGRRTTTLGAENGANGGNIIAEAV
jgi:hypothetical protein